MDINKFNQFVGWTSVFIYCWLVLFKVIPFDKSTQWIMILFLVVALLSGLSIRMESQRYLNMIEKANEAEKENK